MSEVNKSEDLWSSYKDLKNIIWRHLSKDSDDISVPEFKSVLRNYKQNFFSLLQNPPKNAKSREELKKGMEEGINIKGLGHQILSKELYEEAIILSDMYEMNEFVALDLLCTAQIQMSYYPGLPRGLVAVLLYYQGRKDLLVSLRYLVQARTGVQWDLNLKPDIENFITQYTDQLMEGGLFNRIFDLLKHLDLSREIEKLQKNLALGDARHRRQVIDLFQDIRLILADIVFIWATQSGLPKNPTLNLINYLKTVELTEDPSGKLDNVNLYLIMALLAALDLSILHTREDGEEEVQRLPILSEAGYIEAVINELSVRNKWKCDGLQACANLGMAVCLSSLQFIQNQQFEDIVGRSDEFIDSAIELKVFEFLHNILLENSLLYTEQFLYKRMHYLFTDFLVNLYPKVKELRIKADEIARTVQIYAREGLEAPTNLPRYFEFLLLSIAKLYSQDKLKTEYVMEFWSSGEVSGSSRSSPRSVALFKFLRLAGDKLPTTLFVPYVTMMSGLSNCQKAARHCFNLFKQNIQSNLSWDHFFLSFTQYYNNLRQETPLTSDTVYRPNYIKGVSPQELEGLHAVLLLIRTISENDEFSRLAFCEHPGWAPLTILLGLVSCSVPIPLKADLLRTLASLSHSSDCSTQMWENLEASQILMTIPTTSSYAPRGIQTELDEVETRIEEYPLTRAFLTLIDSLTDYGIPKTLGAGPRKPGFDPYLSFIINSVFIKYNSRPYRNPVEKWQVGDLCLKLFEKFLCNYEPQLQDFPKGDCNDFNSPPAYHIMVQLNNKSEILNLILDIIDEGSKLFNEYIPLKGQDLIESCTLRCLNILNLALGLQTKFFNLLVHSNTNILLTNLSKLLLTINRRTGRPDHCINILNYVSFHPLLVSHSLLAIKNIIYITDTPMLHNQFIEIFLTSNRKSEIKYGFVLYLDCEDIENYEEQTVKIKLQILKLLKQCLVYNPPNLTHYLMGFDLKKDISKTEFQYSGVMDLPRSCFHSLISLVECEIAKDTTQLALLESAYELIFLLASNGKTYGPVLRFLRLNKKFFLNHLSWCYTKLQQKVNCRNQMSWLMKILAIELKVTSQLKQVTYLKLLLNFLVSLPPIDKETNQDPFSAKYPDEKILNKEVITTLENLNDNFMLKLLPFFDYQPIHVEQPTWQFFDEKVLEKRIKSCEIDGGKLIDLKKLHQILYDELKQLQSTAVIGKIQAISQEIPKVLKYALELNKNREIYDGIVQFVDAWRQVAEIIMISTPVEILSVKESQLVGISFVLNLLKKLNKIELLSEAAQLISGAILITLNSIKKSHRYEMKLKKIYGSENPCILQIHIGSLKEILESTIEWILSSNVTDEKLRMNLYASLVTVLEVATSEDDDIEGESFISRLDGSRLPSDDPIANLKISTNSFTKFGDKLVETLCRDCIGGNDATKLLALSSISTLITLSGNNNWIKYLSGRGYLKYVIQSIIDSNNDLEKLLEPQQSLKFLYIYMSKMLFLCRLAGTRIGAELLLEHEILSSIGGMNIFHSHPEITKDWMENVQFIPTAPELYLKIWLPTLELSNALLTTLGSDNLSAVTQIMYFILQKLDVVELILRSGCVELKKDNLKELSLLTSLLARISSNNLVAILENLDVVQNYRAHLYRLQKLILGLLPKFLLTETVVKELNSGRLLYALQVMANLLLYAKNLVGVNGSFVIFQPTLSNPGFQLNSTFNDQTSLGVVVQQLICAVSYHQSEKAMYNLLLRKLKDINNMDTNELGECIGDMADDSKFQDINVKREYVYDLLWKRLSLKKKELAYANFIIELSTYLIWVHVDYFMLKAIPKVKFLGGTTANITDGILSDAMEATWKVSTDDISKLKHGLVSIFNDSFTKKLQAAIEERPDLDKGFVETLVKKIIRLIQFVPVK